MELRDKNGLTEAEFLANYKVKDYPKPSLTADILVFAGEENSRKLLLIRRGGHPFLGQWALPGGFVGQSESADEAAARELLEETGVEGLPLSQLGLYSTPGRDPRSWVVSEAYLCVADDNDLHPCAGDDASEAAWFRLEEVLIHSDTISFTLKKDGEVLSGKVEYLPRKKLLSSEGLAFDHAVMIADALLRMKGCRFHG